MAPERIYVATFGESERHVHWFVIARMAELPPGLRLLADMWDDRSACTDDEAADIAGRVRAAIINSSGQ